MKGSVRFPVVVAFRTSTETAELLVDALDGVQPSAAMRDFLELPEVRAVMLRRAGAYRCARALAGWSGAPSPTSCANHDPLPSSEQPSRRRPTAQSGSSLVPQSATVSHS